MALGEDHYLSHFEIMPHLFGNLVDLMDHGMGDPSSLISHLRKGSVGYDRLPAVGVDISTSVDTIDASRASEFLTYQDLLRQGVAPIDATFMAQQSATAAAGQDKQAKKTAEMVTDKKMALELAAASFWHNRQNLEAVPDINDPLVLQQAKAFGIKPTDLVNKLTDRFSPDELADTIPVKVDRRPVVNPAAAVGVGDMSSLLEGAVTQAEINALNVGTTKTDRVTMPEQSYVGPPPAQGLGYHLGGKPFQYPMPVRSDLIPGTPAYQRAADAEAATEERARIILESEKESPLVMEAKLAAKEDPTKAYETRPKVFDMGDGKLTYEIHQRGFLDAEDKAPPAPGYVMFAVTDEGESIREYKKPWIPAPWWVPDWAKDRGYGKQEAIQMIEQAGGMTEEALIEALGGTPVIRWLASKRQEKPFNIEEFQLPAMEYIAKRMSELKNYYVDPSYIRPEIEKELADSGWNPEQISTLFIRTLAREEPGVVKPVTPVGVEDREQELEDQTYLESLGQLPVTTESTLAVPTVMGVGEPTATYQFSATDPDPDYANKAAKIAAGRPLATHGGLDYFFNKETNGFYIRDQGTNSISEWLNPTSTTTMEGFNQYNFGDITFTHNPDLDTWATGITAATDPTTALTTDPTAGQYGLPPRGFGLPPSEQWELIRAGQMGENINPADPRWKARMYGFKPAWGEYLLSGEFGADTFGGWAETTPKMTEEERSRAFQNLINISAGAFPDTGADPYAVSERDQFATDQEKYSRGLIEGYLTEREKVVSMIMAGMGAGQGYGAKYLRDEIGKEFDVYSAQMASQGKPITGFVEAFTNKYNLGITQEA